MSNVTDQAEIVRRKRMVEQMLAAAREADVFFKNMESSVREELAQQGLSGNTIERGLQTISAKVSGPRERMGEIAPLRDRWAEDEIGALDLLNTNWGKWTYHVETGKLKFRNSYQAAEFNRLVRDINQMQAAIVKLQAGFQQQQ